MGTIQKKGNQYFIEFYARGLLYRKCAGKSRLHAQKLLKEIEEEISEGEMRAVDPDSDINAFLKLFRTEVKRVYSLETIEVFEKFLQHFEGFLDKKYSHFKKCSELTPAIIEDYKSFLSVDFPVLDKNLKANVYLALLEAVFDYACRLEVLNDNPTLHTQYFPYQGISINKLSKDCINGISPQIRGAVEEMVKEGVNPKGISFVRFNEILGFDDIYRSAQYFPFIKNLL